MTFGNLTKQSDLRCLFGPMSTADHARLLERLLALDIRLARLAEQATRHVGVPYRALGLGLVVRADGTSAGIHGGPSGDAGDIWFDVSPAGNSTDHQALPSAWTVGSFIIVFCADSPEPRGMANTHDLLRLEAAVDSPKAVLDALELHASIIERELYRHPREKFTSTPHAELS